MGNQQARRMASAAVGGGGSSNPRGEEATAGVPPDGGVPMAPLTYGYVSSSARPTSRFEAPFARRARTFHPLSQSRRSSRRRLRPRRRLDNYVPHLARAFPLS